MSEAPALVAPVWHVTYLLRLWWQQSQHSSGGARPEADRAAMAAAAPACSWDHLPEPVVAGIILRAFGDGRGSLLEWLQFTSVCRCAGMMTSLLSIDRLSRHGHGKHVLCMPHIPEMQTQLHSPCWHCHTALLCRDDRRCFRWTRRHSLRRAWRAALSDSAVQLNFPYWLTPAQRAWFADAAVAVREVRFATPADQLCDPSACGAVEALAARQPNVLPMLTVWSS